MTFRFISIKNADKIKLTVSGITKSKEIKRGEIFKEASTWSFDASYKIDSKNCPDEHILKLVSDYAKIIILKENNQPDMYVFRDLDIPDYCIDDDESSGPNKISKAGIAGIVVAIIVVIAVVIIVIFVIKKRKKNHSSQEGNAESKANEV